MCLVSLLNRKFALMLQSDYTMSGYVAKRVIFRVQVMSKQDLIFSFFLVLHSHFIQLSVCKYFMPLRPEIFLPVQLTYRRKIEFYKTCLMFLLNK